MKVQVRVMENGKTFAGEAVLTELRSGGRLAQKRDKSARKIRPNKPSGAIDGLYGKGFFAAERTLRDSMTQLGHDGYNFSAQSIDMALKSKKFLQRRGT